MKGQTDVSSREKIQINKLIKIFIPVKEDLWVLITRMYFVYKFVKWSE